MPNIIRVVKAKALSWTGDTILIDLDALSKNPCLDCKVNGKCDTYDCGDYSIYFGQQSIIKAIMEASK